MAAYLTKTMSSCCCWRRRSHLHFHWASRAMMVAATWAWLVMGLGCLYLTNPPALFSGVVLSTLPLDVCQVVSVTPLTLTSILLFPDEHRAAGVDARYTAGLSLSVNQSVPCLWTRPTQVVPDPRLSLLVPALLVQFPLLILSVSSMAIQWNGLETVLALLKRHGVGLLLWLGALMPLSSVHSAPAFLVSFPAAFLWPVFLALRKPLPYTARPADIEAVAWRPPRPRFNRTFPDAFVRPPSVEGMIPLQEEGAGMGTSSEQATPEEAIVGPGPEEEQEDPSPPPTPDLYLLDPRTH